MINDEFSILYKVRDLSVGANISIERRYVFSDVM